MSYRWVDHTGELELEIEAPTQREVFADALEAFGRVVGDGSAGEPALREIRLEGDEPAVLLVDWLNELVYLAETESVVPEQVTRLELSPTGVVATVRCRRGNPRHLVKGATYHRLAFEPDSRGFRARVVLDV